jgi:hypothetical protein
MRRLLLPLLILFSVLANAQYKSFRIGAKGDTLNIIDSKGQKQGKWTIHVDPLRGEPGYEEEGTYINDRKEGLWRRYNLMDDLVATENYRWGNKNGICRYFTLAGLEREESWRAFNPNKAYDTIDVADLKDPNKYERVVVKNEGSSLRHGTWKYYYPPTGKLISTEAYFLDQLQEPGAETSTAGLTKATTDTSKAKPAEKPKPKEVLEFEKKTSGKKNKVRDGRTG